MHVLHILYLFTLFLRNLKTHALGAVHMNPVNRASSGHEIVSSAAKEDLNLHQTR